MVIERGEVWWADLGDPGGSEAGFRRPIVVVQADSFNRSRLKTAIGIVLTTNLDLLDAPGNVLIRSKASGLPRDSVANVSQLVTVDRTYLSDRAGRLKGAVLRDIDRGLRLVLDL